MSALDAAREIIAPFCASAALLAALYFTTTSPHYWALMRGIFA